MPPVTGAAAGAGCRGGRCVRGAGAGGLRRRAAGFVLLAAVASGERSCIATIKRLAAAVECFIVVTAGD